MKNVIAEYKNWRIYHKNRQDIKFTSEFDFVSKLFVIIDLQYFVLNG